jgi:hypothetical protein
LPRSRRSCYPGRKAGEGNVLVEILGAAFEAKRLSVTFDLKTLEALRSEKGSDEGKVFNLVRGLQKEIDDDANAAPVLQPLKDRAERILKKPQDDGPRGDGPPGCVGRRIIPAIRGNNALPLFNPQSLRAQCRAPGSAFGPMDKLAGRKITLSNPLGSRPKFAWGRKQVQRIGVWSLPSSLPATVPR